jgi:hypothetical protein
MVNGRNLRPTPSAVVNPDGGWLNRATKERMVNGENSNILLFLKQNANPISTLSVFSYPFSIFGCSFKFIPFASAAGGAA